MKPTSHPAFIQYPKTAAFGRNLPKNKIYEHSGINARLKKLFVEQLEQIIWQYKLAPETIHLPAKPGTPEIQIFTLQLRTPELNHEVLSCIDGAIPFPLIFELDFEGSTQVVAAYKRPSQADASRWVVSDYFATPWLVGDVRRQAMPLALDLGGLYALILHGLIPLPPRPQENLEELIQRYEVVRSKRREMDKMSHKLANERQFNRKVEINARLRQLRAEVEKLTR